MNTPKYPHIFVQLSGTDGNAWAIVGAVRDALLKNKVARTEVKAFSEEAMSGDYDHVLQTCMAWVEVG